MQSVPVAQPATVPLLFVVGLVGAVAATLAMDQVMPRLPEGATPPYIASGVLTERHPDEAPDRLASVVHYIAGLLTGPLFIWLLLASEAVLGRGTTTTVAAGVVLYVLMVAFFAVVVLPRSLVEADRVGTIRRDWAVMAAVYLVVLVPVVAALRAVL